MTTIINTPPVSHEPGGSMNLIIGLIVLVIVAYVFIMFGIPAIQNMKLASPQITIPSKIDVNVTQSK
jgi:hypothetical protein